MNKTRSGFTVVELLIVIVVIAILAAISIVAYNGVQQRSSNTRVISGVNQYVKAFHNYYSINSDYPTTTGCLGANYPSDQCWQGNNGNFYVSASLDAQLSEFVPSKPTLTTSLPVMFNNSDRRGGLRYHGPTKELRYYLEGLNQSCLPSFTFANEGNLTRCIRNL